MGSRDSYPDFRNFEEAADRHGEIVEWHNVSGGYDYPLKIVAPNVAHFQALMERLLQDDSGSSSSRAGSFCASRPASPRIRSISSRATGSG